MKYGLFATGVCFFMIGCAPVSQMVPEPQPTAVPEPALPIVVERPPTVEPVWHPDPIVQTEVKKLQGNGRYRVGDAFFTSWTHVDAYAEEGMAVWRDTSYDDHTALSGEAFDNDALLAAHRHLPLPSFLRVTNLDNNAQTVVRVNDRGPFHSDALIDLSRAAALKLGFGDAQERPVHIELLTESGPVFFLETNYMIGRDTALNVVEELRKLNLGHVQAMVTPHQYENRYRVRIGEFGSLADANYVAEWIATRLQLSSSVIRE